MPITLLTGLPGSGKSRHLIERVNETTASGGRALTFVSSEYPWPSAHGAFLVHRRLVSRQPGLTCRLDNFVPARELEGILDTVDPGTLIAIEEAYAFGPAVVPAWVTASRRGLELLVAAPSNHQIHLLEDDYTEINFAMTCQECNVRDATQIIIRADAEGTLSVCDGCFDLLATAAKDEIVKCLREEHPFPDEEALYQPVELPELASWRLARPDSHSRAALMDTVLDDLGLAVSGGSSRRTYLDIGCNTGLFCDHFAKKGFQAKGVDATRRFITTARLLDSFFRRQQRPTREFVRYELANAYEYLQGTRQERFDVTSAFAVFQWVMIQRSMEHGLSCIEWLAEKTKRVCFLEMGYTREELYQHRLGVEIDRDWVLAALKDYGDFSDIRVINAKTDGLQRDLFVGIKDDVG